jgi:hypothetical protein
MRSPQSADRAVTYCCVTPQAVPLALLKLCTSTPLPAYGAIQGDATGTLTQVEYLYLCYLPSSTLRKLLMHHIAPTVGAAAHIASTLCIHTECLYRRSTLYTTAVVKAEYSKLLLQSCQMGMSSLDTWCFSGLCHCWCAAM